MAREIPEAPKVYTTKYDNFRGVDFTNDASNVWSHRSPNGKNMTPDLAGRPWKRTGWKVVKTVQDYVDCYNTATGESYEGGLTPLKTSYFEIGGEDYLAISNNLGLFFYSKFIGALALDEADLMYIDGFYGEVGTASENTKTTVKLDPDPNRGFFFEGNGKAGFYIFCSYEVSSVPHTELFRYDGQVLRKVDPRVPRIMVGKGPGDSAGTIYEHPNILTKQRICQFYGDGSTKNFILPERADTNDPFIVELFVSGSWVTKTVGTDYSTDDYSYGGNIVTKVSFTNAPAQSDIDNVRVTYSIYGAEELSTTTRTLVAKTCRHGYKSRQRRTLSYTNGKLKNTTPWFDVMIEGIRSDYAKEIIPAEWLVPSIATTNGELDIKVYEYSNSSWVQVSSDEYTARFNPYSGQSLKVDLTRPEYQLYHTTSYEYSTPKIFSTTTKKVDGVTYKTVIQERIETTWYDIPVKVEATVYTYGVTETRAAFDLCQRVALYGDGIINSVFVTGSTVDAYRSRVWWSAVTDPSYFPDTNYIEAGSNDTNIAGLMKVGEYLGIIKQGASMDSTIYLAYPTKIASGSITDGNTTETTYEDTYAIKSSIGGIGAISYGAFNILNDEPLFLSKEGVMGINPTNESEKQLRNRSWYINRLLMSEASLESAFSFVWRNMYILAVGDHCYILDGSQKSSWANEKTNLQYECYYWDNVPVHCFAKMDNELWFTDHGGRLCMFKPDGVPSSYHDDYDCALVSSSSDAISDIAPVNVAKSSDNFDVEINKATWWANVPDTGTYTFTYREAGYLHRTLFGYRLGNSGVSDTLGIDAELNSSAGWYINGELASLSDYGITVTGTPALNESFSVNVGSPIYARWTTILDDDGSPHYFKTLQKKGTMVSLYPQSSSGVRVYLKKDGADKQYIGEAAIRGVSDDTPPPTDFYLKKKAKKYKRLQIIVENDGYDETFGVDEIIKCYTLGNYSRNR